MEDAKIKPALTEAELASLRDQLRAAVSGAANIDLFADAMFHDNSNCSPSHGSHAQSGSHGSHCDSDGFI